MDAHNAVVDGYTDPQNLAETEVPSQLEVRSGAPGSTQLAQLFLLAIFAGAIGLLAGAVKLWQWSRGRSSVYRLLSIALLVGGLWFLLGAVGVFLNPL